MTDEDTGAPLGSNLCYEGKDLFYLVYGKRHHRTSLDFKSPDRVVGEYFSKCNICLDS